MPGARGLSRALSLPCKQAGLAKNNQFVRRHKASCLQLIEIDSARETSGLKNGLVSAGLFQLVYERLDFTPEDIVHGELHM